MPKTLDMMKMFLQMTPEQRDYVYEKSKQLYPGVETAYKAANNLDFYNKTKVN